MNWTKEVPTTEGMYWFYGLAHGVKWFGEIKAELLLVRVAFDAGGIPMYVAGRGILYPSKEQMESCRATGYWVSAEMPATPEFNIADFIEQ